MLIIVSGFAGSGKSTLANSLGKKYRLGVVHASDILHKLKEKEIHEIDASSTSASSGWWESEEAEKYLKKRLEDGSMDKALDSKLKEIAEKGDVVLDSKTMGNLSKKGFRIWLNASAEKRAERIAERDGLNEKEVLKKINDRDSADRKIYKNLYGFSLGKDLSGFDLVIHSDELSAEEVFEKAVEGIEKNKN